jgi:hypothetical protein
VQQDRLKKYDWLWKVLVYGSYLDFNFIKRLNDKFKTIQEIIEQEKIIFKQGLKRKDGTKTIKVSELKGIPFLDTQKKQLQQFLIVESNQKWDSEYVGYIYQQQKKPYIELFKPYSLLITEGVLPDFTSNAAINHNEKIFTSSIRALKIQEQSKLDILYGINSILCSSLFAYYALNIASSVGIEREQTQDEEIEKMWHVRIPDIISKGQKIEEYQTNKYTLKSQLTREISIRQQCDDIVLPSLSLTEEEKELLNYANDITIPLQMKHNGYERLLLPCKNNDKILNDYAHLFIDRFASNFEKIGKKFIVAIWHTNQIIGMFFKVIPESEYTKQIDYRKQNNADVFQKIIELGTTKITDKLFVQKDIRGFEKDYFYIFKPNEKRLWHKAVGYLDVNEFEEAILKAGRDGK